MRFTALKELTGAVVITVFPPRGRKRAGAQLKCVGDLLATAEDVRRTGSAALDLAYVACGRSDAYFESGVQPWDIAAGVLMVREAGGRIFDFRGAATGLLHIETGPRHLVAGRSEEHQSELPSLMRLSYAVFCLKTKKHSQNKKYNTNKK